MLCLYFTSCYDLNPEPLTSQLLLISLAQTKLPKSQFRSEIILREGKKMDKWQLLCYGVSIYLSREHIFSFKKEEHIFCIS